MKIQKIYIKNINSLAGEHHIDFTIPPLSTAALFAITGPTGAGKSTILDAICLALYDQCPRVSKANKSTIESSGAIITRGTSESEAMVEYEQTGKIYRSRWTIQYSKKGNLGERKMELSCFDDSESDETKQWPVIESGFKKVTEKNTEISKLDYGQFTRSILLAQGEFAKLLTSSKDDRYALMEKITGDDTYRKLGKKIFEVAKAKTEEINVFGAELNTMVFLTEDQKVDFAHQIKELKEKIAVNNLIIKQLNELIHTKNQLAIKDKRQIALSEQLEAWKIDNENFSIDNKRLADFETVRPIFSLVKELESLQKTLRELQLANEEATTQLQSLENRYQEKETYWSNTLNIAFNKDNCIDVLTTQFRDIKDKQDDFSKANNELDTAKKEEGNARTALETFQNQLNGTKAEIKVKEESQAAVNVNIAPFDSLIASFNSLDVWNNNHERLNKEATAIQKENGKDANEKILAIKSFLENSLAEINNKIATVESKGDSAKINDLLNGLGTKKTNINLGLEALAQLETLNKELVSKNASISIDKNNTEGFSASIIELEAKLLEIEKSRAISQKILKMADAALHFEAIKAELREGDACPLCGSTSHPGIEYEDLEYLMEKDKEIEKEQTFIKEKLKNDTIKKAQAEQNVFNNEGRISQIKMENATIENDKIKLVGDFLGIGKDAVTKEVLNSTLTSLNEESIVLKKIQTELNQLPELIRQKTTIEARLEKCKKWAIDWHDFINTINSETKITTREEVNAFLNALSIKKKDYDSLTENKGKLTTQLSELNATLANQVTNVNSAIQQLQTRTTTLTEKEKVFENCKTLYYSLPNIGDAALVSQKEIPAFTKLLTEIANKHTSIKEIDGKIISTNIAFSLKNKEVSDSISATGYSTIEEVNNLYIMPEEEGRIRKQKNELAITFTAITTELGTIDKEILELKEKDNPELTIDSVQVDLLEKEGNNNADKEHCWKYENALTEDKNLIEQHKVKLSAWESMKKAASPYLMLNDLIGDAVGKRFNEFAQELTLKKLLISANANLKGINPRYQLDINDENESSESIYVVDSFMGNSRRAADITLSGGETFMASLSLALGLSDMAAGKAELGNLFIDEGFGSLDQESLDYAIGILEELQHKRGRVIGIISHVSELKEKIQTQIKIEKRAGGTSVIVPF